MTCLLASFVNEIKSFLKVSITDDSDGIRMTGVAIQTAGTVIACDTRLIGSKIDMKLYRQRFSTLKSWVTIELIESEDCKPLVDTTEELAVTQSDKYAEQMTGNEIRSCEDATTPRIFGSENLSASVQ